METIQPALVLIGIIVFIVTIMVYINNRDRKRDAGKKTSDQ